MKLNYQFFPITDSQLQQPVVVLIHGLFGNLDNLGVARKYLNQTYPVLSVDLRNHGQSPWSDEMNYAAMSQDIITLMNDLSIDHAHFIGHSMGGKTAMAVALAAPERVLSLTVADIAPVQYQENRHQAVITALQSVLDAQIPTRREADQKMAEFISETGVRQFLLKSFIPHSTRTWQFNVEVIANCYADIMDWPFDTESYSGKTLFIKGSLSDYLLAEHQSAIQKHFPAAKAHIMHGCGHWVHAEKPELFHQILHKFLSTV